MALTELRQVVANVPEPNTREALFQLLAVLGETFNAHTHVSAADGSATSLPTSASPTKSVPDGSGSAFPT